MFLRSAWYVAGWAAEFRVGELQARTIANEPLVLTRKLDNTLVALFDRCPHRWAPLSRGRAEGDAVRCMYHGALFSADGRCIEIPGQEQIPALRVKTFPVVERHKWAWVWMGDPQKADAALIPNASHLDEDLRRLNFGKLDFEANASFIMDNLVDLTHISYLHESTLGFGGFNWGGRRAQVHELERGIYFETWTRAGTNVSVVQPKGAPAADLWARYSYYAPGIFINEMATFPAGTADLAKDGAPPPGIERYTDTMSCQAVTPVSATSSRYYFAAGPRASDMTEEQTDEIWNVACRAFAEDKGMLEAQQRMFEQFPQERMGWSIQTDRGPQAFRRMMERLIRLETVSDVPTRPATA